MGGWASILVFCSGRAGGRRDYVVENRVGVGGRPDTPGPVGGPGLKVENGIDIKTPSLIVARRPRAAAVCAAANSLRPSTAHRAGT